MDVYLIACTKVTVNTSHVLIEIAFVALLGSFELAIRPLGNDIHAFQELFASFTCRRGAVYHIGLKDKVRWWMTQTNSSGSVLADLYI